MGWLELARYFGGSGREISSLNKIRACWPYPNWPEFFFKIFLLLIFKKWPDILEGRAMKLAARIKSGPIGPARIGPARIGPQPIQVRAGPARLARIFFKNFFIIKF